MGISLSDSDLDDDEFGETHDIASAAKALGLTADDLDAQHPPQTISTGMPICVVPLASLEAAQR